MTRRGALLLGLVFGVLSCGGDSPIGASATLSDTDATTTDAFTSTTGDTIAEGSAEGSSDSGSGVPPECVAVDDPVCDDNDPCTIDECFDDACTHNDEADFTPCTDGDGAAGLCRDGECVVECETDRECNDDNVCTTDTCDLSRGLCVREPLDDVEADPSEQTPADCRVVECDNGEPVENPDDTDLPTDDNECTTDSCTAGEPVFNPAGPGGACGLEGICNSEGECVDCLSPTDCSDLPEDDDCQVRTCVDGVCGQEFTDADTPVNATLQTDGNCQLIVCDGAGDMDSVDDDVDVPVDGLECTEDICTSGLPFNPPLDEGSDCEAGVCNATGGCVGCIFPTDCGGVNTFCQTITCVANTCGVSNTAAGVALPNGQQAPNDCQELQCNGSGATQSVPDNGDLPEDDGNQCTGESCSNGMELHPDEDIDTPCDQDGGVVCDGAGACVECNAASQCSNAQQCEVDACVDHACTPQDDVAGAACDDGEFCTATDTCDGSGSCGGTGDPCAGPDGDSNCSESCNEATNSCDADDPVGSSCDDGLFCSSSDTCNAVGTCVGGADPCPGSDGDGNCAESCDEGSDNCNAPDPPGTTCNDGNFCTGTDQCNVGGSCVGGADPCPGADGDGNCSESCDELADSCTGPDVPGATCNDGFFCTQVDACAGGACMGSGTPCSGADGDANCAESCDETADSCTAIDPVGSACSDGLFCTGVDACNASGTCEGAGSPCPGPDGDGNCAESCNESADNCTANDANLSTCNDGVFCNGDDTCNGLGSCANHTGSPCPGADGDGDCTESCRETQDDCNGNDPLNSACDDDVFCNGTDTCGNLGGCGQHAGNPCDGADGDGDCTETCRETQNDCNGNDPLNSACDDGVFCNGDDTCGTQGGCGQHAGNPCDGAGDNDNDCSELCNETLGNCSNNDPNGSFCNDGSFCNGNDTCNGGGLCANHVGDPCLPLDSDCDCSESCNENTNNCTANDPNGNVCGFGLCSGGSCIGICF